MYYFIYNLMIFFTDWITRPIIKWEFKDYIAVILLIWAFKTILYDFHNIIINFAKKMQKSKKYKNKKYKSAHNVERRLNNYE